MLMIRLQRVGRKNDPSFRVIVTDSKNAAKRGRPTEIVGSYNARMGKPEINVDRVKYWLSVGAQASGTVHNLLVDAGAVSGKKVNVLPKKTPIVKEVPKEEVKAAPVKEEAPVEVKAEEAAPEVKEEAAPVAEEVAA